MHSHPLPFSTLAEAWALKETLFPPDLPERLRVHFRMEFYNGAAAMFDLMSAASEVESEDVAMRRLDGFDAEIKAFARELAERLCIQGKAH